MGRTFVPTLYPLVDPKTGLITSQWRRYQEGVATAVTPGSSGEVLTSNGVALVWQPIVNANVGGSAAIAYSKLNLATSIVNADIATAAAIAWTKISKSGSSLADLATRSAADLNAGTLSATRLPSLSQMVIALTTSSTVAGGSTTYVGALGESATEANIHLVMPVAGVLRNLYVIAGAAPGASESFTYTVRLNAADTTITCAVSGGTATTAHDTTHTATVAAGGTVDIKLVTSASASAARHAIGVELATS